MQDALPEDLACAWDGARDELRASLPPATFDLWLAPLCAVAAQGDTLYVRAPDAVRVWVERKYRHRLECALRTRSDQLRSIHLLAAAEAAPEDLARGLGAPAELPIRPTQTFDRFIIGPGNRVAHAAALAVAELPGEAYNPLFLHGAPGLGKTHLLGAIAHYVRRHRPDITVRYTTAERFTAEFVTALRSKGAERFKARHRGAGVLLIDDVQFLEGKPHTEEEFFHTFNVLYEAGGQLVLSCDRPPEALSRLAERLRDRFEWGLRVELTPPDLRTRLTLLEYLARSDVADPPPDETLREIAVRVPTNFRRLEGALVRVCALASISDQPPTPELVREVFAHHPHPDAPLAATGGSARTEPTLDEIQEAVCAVLHLSRDELLSSSRVPRIARGRHVAMYLGRELTTLSLSRIAAAFGRDHSTVVHAIRRVEAALEPGSDIHQAVDKSRTRLGGGNSGHPPSTGSGLDLNNRTSDVTPAN